MCQRSSVNAFALSASFRLSLKSPGLRSLLDPSTTLPRFDPDLLTKSVDLYFSPQVYQRNHVIMILYVTCTRVLLVLLLSLSADPQFLSNRDGGIVVDPAGGDSLSLLLRLLTVPWVIKDGHRSLGTY